MNGQRARFGEQLKRHREAAGYSQEELAALAGLSANAISALERGERKRPYPNTLRRLTEALRLNESARAELASSLSREDHAPTTAEYSAPEPIAELPGELAPLIGRAREADVARRLLLRSDGRLLTLTGPGGVGKTRLAIHVAKAARDQFPDGVVWVDLAPLADAALVLPTIARSLGLQATHRGAMHEAPGVFLRTRRALLVLDNFEHVLDAATDVAELLLACPNLAVLATSRAALNLRGEQEYVVPPLELPAASRERGVGDILAVPSVQLFVRRVQHSNPSFVLTEENVALVTAICRRLDGVPLALELAAARMKLLGLAELLDRLDQALPVLTGGPRDLPARQRTMEGAIRWSYDLLAPPEQVLFRRLAIFADGWSLQAAEAVGQEDPCQEFDLLGRLVGQSLVTVVDRGDDSSWYSMLEPVRQFARRLLESAGEIESTAARHNAYYLQFAERVAPELVGPHRVAWLERLEAEVDNLRAAVVWALGSVHEADAVRLTYTLRRFFWMWGLPSEVRKWTEAALKSDTLDVITHARATYLRCLMRYRLGETPSHQDVEKAAKILRADGDGLGAADAYLLAGLVRLLGGDIGHGERHLRLSHRLYTSVGDTQGSAQTLVILGGIPFREGDLVRAGAFFERSLTLAQSSGDPLRFYTALYSVALVAQGNADYELAEAYYARTLTQSQRTKDWSGVGYAMIGMAECRAAQHDARQAARLYGVAEAVFASVGMTFQPFQATAEFHDHYRELTRTALGDEAFDAAREAGKAISLEAAIAEALTQAGT